MPNYGFSASYVRSAGLGNASSYQVSGKPFITGNLDIDQNVEDKIVFPNVTKRIVIQNMADVDLRVHFATTASTSVNSTSCFFIDMKLISKLLEICLRGSSSFSDARLRLFNF